MSSLPYIQQLSKVIVAQITQTIGWNSIQTTPLELLTDILHKYLEELTRQTQRYTELYGRTEPNLDDVALAFNDLNINIADLEEYITNVDPVPCIINVPKFPIPKESNLNFLKPGSKEVVTRPVHIHEHLPPIQPHEETPPAEVKPTVESIIDDGNNSTNIIQTYISTKEISDNSTHENNDGFVHETHDDGDDVINVIGETTVVENHTSIASTDESTFKKPFDAPQPQSTANQRPISNNAENVNGTNIAGKPTREIISCFMTTGGFISPAREGKLPEAKKPIIIEEEPEPEEIPPKQRTPSPEIVERKHHSNKRDRENKTDQFDTSNKSSDDSVKHNESSYADEDEGKEVKLYEVIQAAPDPPPPKKKTKKSQVELATLKEMKKLNRIKINQKRKLLKNRSNDDVPHSFVDGLAKGDAHASDIMINDKIKKKLHKMETLKKKHKQKQLAQMSFSDSNPDLVQQKQHKKRMSKLSKKNLEAMGLNPNAIEGFAIPPPMDYSVHEANALPDPMKLNMYPKDSVKKNKKLSSEPDKQKIKFFKKLSSTSSNLMSKMNESREHDIDRMVADTSNMSEMVGMSSSFNTSDSFDNSGQFGQMASNLTDLSRLPSNIDDLPPSKKQKLLKKLSKPPKEPKTPKIKKLKKEPLAKKERIPKMPKLLDVDGGIPAQPTNMDENPMSKIFLPDEFRPNVDLMNQFPLPGLNPLNPLFQSVRFDLQVRDQMQNYPFPQGPMPNFDFANLSRFKRPNFNDPDQVEIENVSKHSRDMNNPPSKPLCNVAPLMPPSLLNMEMQRKDDYMANESINEFHSSSQKHYPEMPITPKKSVHFNNPPGQYGAQSYTNCDSPIVIMSDDDDKVRSNPSQSPNEADTSFGGSEVKRKKVKDKKDKEKKEKKDKDTGVIKVKKKKDKKDKSKNKGEHSKPPKDKAALKEEKRKKKKERERFAAALSMDTNDSMGATSNLFYGSQTYSDWPRDSITKEADHSQMGDSSDINATFNTDNSNLETNAIPKLTLKLAPSSSSPSSRTSRPSTPDFPVNKKSSKKKKKQWRTIDDDSERSEADESIGTSGKVVESNEQMKRDPSPEMARISALITRPPKQKSSKQQSVEFNSSIRNEYFDASTPARSDYHSAIASSTPMPPTPTGRGRPKGSSSLKSSKKAAKASASFSAGETDKKSTSFENQSTMLDPQVNVSQNIDEQILDNQVWICPACGRVDDGTPMIGCDGCDAWYHWVCVGILVPPNEDQDWFCRVCMSKKQDEKKKKRKKKDKKDH